MNALLDRSVTGNGFVQTFDAVVEVTMISGSTAKLEFKDEDTCKTTFVCDTVPVL